MGYIVTAGRVVARGVLVAGGDEVPVVVEQVFQVPGRSRTVVRMEPKGQKQEVLHVVIESTRRSDDAKMAAVLRRLLTGTPQSATLAAEIHHVAALPRNHMGKVQRDALKRQLGLR